jgi:drug/metabolite transporter (DMT)-like permease
VVTRLTFASNDRLGPSVTGAVSSTAPLFALAAAFCVVGGIALFSWRGGAALGRALWLPLTGAALRGLAQVLAKAALTLWADPFAASLIGYCVSTATVTATDRMARRAALPRRRTPVLWFMLTGVLNGAAVLLMYAALNAAPVALVAPLVAAYPLVTLLLGAALLREEAFDARVAAGALLTVGGIAYLVSGS